MAGPSGPAFLYRFLSTLSLRRATEEITTMNIDVTISIHALLAESDGQLPTTQPPRMYFYPRSPCGERRKPRRLKSRRCVFLSTLSLRRATVDTSKDIIKTINFYPRSPCGERPAPPAGRCIPHLISIHALLAESDFSSIAAFGNIFKFLSTLSLRRATLKNAITAVPQQISIHALLAESDEDSTKSTVS